MRRPGLLARTSWPNPPSAAALSARLRAETQPFRARERIAPAAPALTCRRCVTTRLCASAELFEELQLLPGGLHSEFPDLAVDFLASVFKARTGVGGASCDSRPCLSCLAPFQVHTPADGSSHNRRFEAGTVNFEHAQSFLTTVADEAASIEATASTPAGWGSLAVNLATSGSISDSKRSQRAASEPEACGLLECRQCHRVLLASCALHHQQNCRRQVQCTLSAELSDSQSELHSSSDEQLAARSSDATAAKRSRHSKGWPAS